MEKGGRNEKMRASGKKENYTHGNNEKSALMTPPRPHMHAMHAVPHAGCLHEAIVGTTGRTFVYTRQQSARLSRRPIATIVTRLYTRGVRSARLVAPTDRCDDRPVQTPREVASRLLG